MNLDFVHDYARKAHEGQVRKYTGEPYVEHCIAVARLFQTMGPVNAKALYAAVLHDTVEDTDITFDDLRRDFDDTIAEYVWYLTKPEEFVGDRAQRKALDRARLALAPDDVKFVKICDIMHNAGSIKEHDPEKWESWRDEMILLLDAMKAHHVWKSNAMYQFVNHYDRWVETVLLGDK